MFQLGRLKGEANAGRAMPFQTKRGFRQRLLGIPLGEASFGRRGFRQSNAKAVSHLEKVGRKFLEGYNAALAVDDVSEVVSTLNATRDEFRGFAYEGAAMALKLLDSLTPWRRPRLQHFLANEGAAHVYMVHVGAGWALARLPRLRRKIERRLVMFDPLLRPLVVDGLAFSAAFFNPRVYVRAGKRPKHLTGYWLRAFDQGVGRSLWFVEGAEVAAIASTIATFEQTRQRDLWSGVGLACTYAGGVSAEEIQFLKAFAGPHLPHLAQGATFAAKARQRASIVGAHTELACNLLCGMSAADAALLADDALKNLPHDPRAPAYEIWRRRIQAQYSREVEFA